MYHVELSALTIAFRCRIIKFCRLTWILTRPAKSSRELRCSIRQQLFFGLPGASVQHQVLARQSQVHRSPRSRVDGVGPATEKTSSHLPDILHHTQRKFRFANREPQLCGRPFPSHTTSLRYSESAYDVSLIADLANQTPPSDHQCTFGGSRTPKACARRHWLLPTTKISQTVIE